MNSDDATVLRKLLAGQRILSLGVLVDGEPYVGLVPFALTSDARSLVVHTSRLARHSAGLSHGGRYGALIHETDLPDADALQLPRLSVQGEVQLIEPGTTAWQRAHDLYVTKFPTSEMTFGLGDFSLHALVLERGRLVVGFARTINVGPEEFGELTRH